MKLIIENYGRAIVALCIFTGIMGFFYQISYKNKQGVAQLMGIMIEETIHADTLLTETGEAFFQYNSKPLPKIFFKNAYALKVSEYVKVSDCFYAKDYKGNSISVQVTNIYNASKGSVSTIIKNGIEFFYFELAGIYEVYVKAVDTEGKTQIAYVKLFVQ